MNETIEVLKKRRSCRNYLNTEVPVEILDQIIEAGTYAATGRDMQSPIIVCITNKTIIKKLSKLNALVRGKDEDPFFEAPALLVVLANRDVPTYLYDGSLVMGNLMNAAAALSVSSCWVHRAREVFEMEEAKNILKAIGIFGNYEGIGNLVLGYSADVEEKKPSDRKKDYIYYLD